MEEPCRFFAQGRCAFGSACRFAHPAPKGAKAAAKKAPPPNASAGAVCRPVPKPDAGGRQICRFFANGNCTFGDACRNLHQRAETPAEALLREHVEMEEPEVLPYHQQPWGEDDSFFSHGGLMGPGGPTPFEPPSLSRSSDPFPPMPPAQPSAARRGQQSFPSGKVQERASGGVNGEDAECGICFDSIRRKGERFGMLESCDHAFCLTCIRAWRKERERQDRNNLRLCPVCRTESFFVVPSDNIISDPEEKRLAVEKYQKQMAKLPCKLFDYGRGKCPFGTSCFYAHLNPDGTRFVPAPLRRMAGAGGTLVVNEVKISDFFS